MRHSVLYGRTVIEAMVNACSQAGVIPPSPSAVSRAKSWIIADIDGDPHGKGDARIRLFADTEGGIVYNWKTQDYYLFFVGDEGEVVSDNEALRRKESYLAAQVEIKKEHDKQAKQAAKKACILWDKSQPLSVDHPYITKKGITDVPLSLREVGADVVNQVLGYFPRMGQKMLSGRIIVARVGNFTGVKTAELIDEVGSKSAIKGGVKSGSWYEINTIPANTKIIGVCEGIATALSVAQGTGFPCVAALSCKNLKTVAVALKSQYPSASICIYGDIGNGQSDAENAAQAVMGRCLLPQFTPDEIDAFKSSHAGKSPTDWNDSAQLCKPIPIPEEANMVEESPFPDLDKRPCFIVLDNPVERGGTKYKEGVYYCEVKYENAGKVKVPVANNVLVCSPIHIAAAYSDEYEDNHGRLLKIKSPNDIWVEWAMPSSLAGENSAPLISYLLQKGVTLHSDTKDKLLVKYLRQEHLGKKARVALRVGWFKEAYVLPNRIIGPGAEDVIFQSNGIENKTYATSGTLEEWVRTVSVKAIGNPLLLLALSAGFEGPMLRRTNTDGAGIHFVGNSSTGKTTLLEAACSIWGGENYKGTWRTTANGLEASAALSNDSLLVLDEISQCNPREIGGIVYTLFNGKGKRRANKLGEARAVAQWKCSVLSSGERTIETAMGVAEEALTAGQGLRMLDIPVERAYGAWDRLPKGMSGCEFSNSIKGATKKYYGTAGIAFLEKLAYDKTDYETKLESFIDSSSFFVEEPQHKRAASRFASIALAGEVATSYGITGWEKGDATTAAVLCLELWQALHGEGNDETRKIKEQLQDFLSRHGDARFSSAHDHDAVVRDRAGWWRVVSDERVYLLTAEGMKDALKGFDFNRSLKALEQIGVLKSGGDGRYATLYSIGGRKIRLYNINPSSL